MTSNLIADSIESIQMRISGKFRTAKESAMTKQAKDRANKLRSAGVVEVRKSGAVCVDWNKAIKSDYLKKELEKMSELEKSAKQA